MAEFPGMGSRSAHLEEVLRNAVLRLRRATGLPVAFGGLVVDRGSVTLTEVMGAVSGALPGLEISRGRGLGGKAMARRRAEVVDDYLSALNITHDYDVPVNREGLRAVLAVPVVVRPDVRAVLYSALRHPQPLGERVSAAAAVVDDFRFQLQVSDEVERRLATLEAAAAEPAATRMVGPVLEELRAVHAELMAIASTLDNPDLRSRIHSAGRRLAWALGGSRSDGGAQSDAGLRRLSPREIDVLAQVALGCTNAETARRLGLLPETVKSYLSSACRKLDSHTRLEAVVAARAAGLLP